MTKKAERTYFCPFCKKQVPYSHGCLPDVNDKKL